MHSNTQPENPETGSLVALHTYILEARFWQTPPDRILDTITDVLAELIARPIHPRSVPEASQLALHVREGGEAHP